MVNNLRIKHSAAFEIKTARRSLHFVLKRVQVADQIGKEKGKKPTIKPCISTFSSVTENVDAAFNLCVGVNMHG